MKNKQVSLKTGAFIIALAGLLLVGGTLAFLQAAVGNKTNTFSGDRPKVNVAIVEKKPDESGNTVPIETGEGQEYGKLGAGSVEKIVAVNNKNDLIYPTGDTLVRVRVVPSFVYDDGVHAGTTVACDMSKINITAIDNDLNAEAKWKKIETSNQNYYYYPIAVKPDENTEFLKFTASYNGDIPTGAQLVLEVLTEGVSYNSSNPSEGWKFAKDAWSLNDAEITEIYGSN